MPTSSTVPAPATSITAALRCQAIVSRERGDGHQAAAAALLAVGKEQVCAAPRAEPRVGDAVGANPGRRELELVGGPEIEAPLSRARRCHPGFPSVGKGGPERLHDGTIHLVAARADGGEDTRDGGGPPRSFPPPPRR